jgi:protein gp37
VGDVTGIEWADHTFNPWIGCSRVSPACGGCYAADWAKRYRGRETGTDLWRRHGARPVTAEATWAQPLRWERQAAAEGRVHRVFCASLADVFEDRRDLDEPRARLWQLIAATPI